MTTPKKKATAELVFSEVYAQLGCRGWFRAIRELGRTPSDAEVDAFRLRLLTATVEQALKLSDRRFEVTFFSREDIRSWLAYEWAKIYRSRGPVPIGRAHALREAGVAASQRRRAV